MKQYHYFFTKPICTTFKWLRDAKNPIENSRNCLTSPCISKNFRRCSLWLHANHGTLDTSLLHGTSRLYFIHSRHLLCVEFFWGFTSLGEFMVHNKRRVSRWSAMQYKSSYLQRSIAYTRIIREESWSWACIAWRLVDMTINNILKPFLGGLRISPAERQNGW